MSSLENRLSIKAVVNIMVIGGFIALGLALLVIALLNIFI